MLSEKLNVGMIRKHMGSTLKNKFMGPASGLVGKATTCSNSIPSLTFYLPPTCIFKILL